MSDKLFVGFDCSNDMCSVALMNRNKAIADLNRKIVMGQSEVLFPLLEEMLKVHCIAWTDLNGIGVGVGPGNFTGLRVAVAAARGLAMSLNIPTIGVNSFEALAPKNGWALVTLTGKNENILIQLFRNGKAWGEPTQKNPEVFEAKDFPKETVVFGSKKEIVSKLTGLKSSPLEVHNLGIPVAKIAINRMNSNTGSPSPMYLREPNAAIPSEMPLKIIGDQ